MVTKREIPKYGSVSSGQGWTGEFKRPGPAREKKRPYLHDFYFPCAF